MDRAMLCGLLTASLRLLGIDPSPHQVPPPPSLRGLTSRPSQSLFLPGSS